MSHNPEIGGAKKVIFIISSMIAKEWVFLWGWVFCVWGLSL